MMPMNSRPRINVIIDTTRSAVPGLVKNTNTAETNVIVVAILNQACRASGFIGVDEMTSDITAPFGFLEQRHNFFTHFSHIKGTAGMERAARWQS